MSAERGVAVAYQIVVCENINVKNKHLWFEAWTISKQQTQRTGTKPLFAGSNMNTGDQQYLTSSRIYFGFCFIFYCSFNRRIPSFIPVAVLLLLLLLLLLRLMLLLPCWHCTFLYPPFILYLFFLWFSDFVAVCRVYSSIYDGTAACRCKFFTPTNVHVTLGTW